MTTQQSTVEQSGSTNPEPSSPFFRDINEATLTTCLYQLMDPNVSSEQMAEVIQNVSTAGLMIMAGSGFFFDHLTDSVPLWKGLAARDLQSAGAEFDDEKFKGKKAMEIYCYLLEKLMCPQCKQNFIPEAKANTGQTLCDKCLTAPK
jgi:hypothetical protein